MITSDEIVTAIVLYSTGHATYKGLCFAAKRAEHEVVHVITAHVKNGHKDRLKHCLTGSCVKL